MHFFRRRLVNVFVVVVFLGLTGAIAAQERDVSAGSSSGSIRPDVLDVTPGPRTRALSPEKRATLVEQLESFRGAERLIGTPSFDALKADYTEVLEKTSVTPITKELTPLKYLVFRLMSNQLSSRRPGTSADQLAERIITSYVKTGNSTRPILSYGFTRVEAKDAEREAVAAIKRLQKSATNP